MQKMKLNTKERVLLTFQHKETDRIPIWGQIMNVEFIEKITGRKLCGSPEQKEMIIADAYTRAGIDVIPGIRIPRWEVIKEEEFEIKYDGYFNWKIGGDKAYTLEQAIEHVKRKIDQDFKVGDALDFINDVNRVQRLLGEKTLIVPFVGGLSIEGLYHTVGFENFAIIMYEHGSLIDECLEVNMNHALKTIQIINENYDGPFIQIGDDLGMKGTTLFSPEWLREHFFPRLKKIGDKIRAGNKYFCFHSCGYIMDIIPDLINAGVTALNPIEQTAGMDLRKIKKQYGDKLVLAGNVNVNIVQMGSCDDVRKEVRRCLDDAAKGGGYFLKEGITPKTPVENIMAYLDEAQSYKGWAHLNKR